MHFEIPSHIHRSLDSPARPQRSPEPGTSGGSVAVLGWETTMEDGGSYMGEGNGKPSLLISGVPRGWDCDSMAFLLLKSVAQESASVCLDQDLKYPIKLNSVST